MKGAPLDGAVTKGRSDGNVTLAVPKILRPVQQAWDRMVRRQSFERSAEGLEIRLRRANFEQATVLLHHIDSGSAVACVDHEAHRAARLQDVAKGAKADVRILQVVKHSGTNHQVEGSTHLPDPLDREFLQLEIFEIVLSQKIARVPQACVACVDRHDPGVGLAERVSRGLRGAAARDQYLLVFTGFLLGPYRVELGSTTVRILPQVAVA